MAKLISASEARLHDWVRIADLTGNIVALEEANDGQRRRFTIRDSNAVESEVSVSQATQIILVGRGS